jgi:hypothetical protein
VEEINTKEMLSGIMEAVGVILDDAWKKYSHTGKPSRWGKNWWNDECAEELKNVKIKRSEESKRRFRRATAVAKKAYFEKRIKSIASDRGRPWDLMPWVKERKLPTMEALLDKEGRSCNTEEEVFTTLHETFNAAQKRKTDLGRFYEEIAKKPKRKWGCFSTQELEDALKGCAKNSTPGPDHVLW